jgi:DNA topoisomerase-1
VLREISDAELVTAANGKPLTRGKCAVCGSVLMRVGQVEKPRAANESVPPPGDAVDMTLPSPLRQPVLLPPEPPADNQIGTRPSRQPTRATATETRSPARRTARPRRGRAKSDSEEESAQADSARRVPSAAGSSGALVIVESPAKAKTISKFLGREYRVRASLGHIRDLPVKEMGVDIEHDFKPKYEITAKKRDVVQELREYAQGAKEIYLATDPDREGEAISWHLASVLKAQITGKPIFRVEFHEITGNAIADAFSHPRAVDMGRVDAQQARRVLDRIVGYTLSPLLAKKMKKWTLSAGRVQSVAVRLVVEREREIQNFVAVEYWSIEAELQKQLAFRTTSAEGIPNPDIFRARLVKVQDQDFECHSGEDALKLKEVLEKCAYRVLEVRRKDVTRNPYAPYITSTLQQDASRRLGYNPKRTMKLAQELYEGIDIGEEGTVGLITYMRTDSTHVAEAAQKEALEYITQKFGENYLPAKPRVYAKKVAGAQEAHEAIRPTKTFREPGAIRQYLNNEQFKLYDLIWKRFVASQMASAVFDTTAVDIAADQPTTATTADAASPPPSAPVPGVARRGPDFLFRANGSLLKFAGYLAVYGRSVGDEDEEDDADKRLPPLAGDEPLDLLGIYPEQHFTEPPPRFTEATLIKALEQHGIGRPSTYAPIMANIQERDYIEQIENRRLKPTELGFVVNDLLVAHFPDIVDLAFTAKMEEKLDAVEEGKQNWVALMHDFYGPFKETVERAGQEMPMTHLADPVSDQLCDLCGSPMVIKKGKYGKFLSCSRFPACKGMKKLTTGVRCPKCKEGELRERKSKKGRVFYGCSRWPQCDMVSWDKPVNEPCPNCGGLLVQGTKDVIRCVNGDYKREGKAEIKN